MLLEQNLPVVLTVGFFAILFILAGSTLFLWIKNKWNRSAYLFIILHIILLAAAFTYGIKALDGKFQWLVSGDSGLPILIAGGLWILSIASLFISIFVFTRLSEKRYYTER